MRRAVFLITRHYGLPVAGLIFLLEGLGVPIPVEVPLIFIGDRLARRPEAYWEMVFLMWSMTVIGNTIGYVLGYRGGRSFALRLISLFGVKPETWDRIELWFRRHGLKAVVLTRWINWGFAQNMWLCGITRVPFRKFFTVMVINDFLWAMGWTFVAMVGWRWVVGTFPPFMRRTAHVFHMSPMQLALLAAAAVVGAGLLIWRRRKRKHEGGTGSPTDGRSPGE